MNNPRTGDTRVGNRRSQTFVSITVAATSTTLYQLTVSRTAIIRKAIITNRAGASTQVIFGETVAAVWTPRFPPLFIPNNQDVELEEEMIPAFEFTSDIIGRASAAGADPADVQVILEVEEFD